MPNQKNVESVQKLEEKIKEFPNMVVTTYQGLPTSELNELRSKLKPMGCEYSIVKNTLTKIALKKAGLEEFSKFFDGPTAVAFQKGDVCGLSKIIMEFAKDREKFKVLAGVMDGKLLSDKEIKILAALPPKQVLLTQLAVCLNQPIQQIATVLNAPIQKLALVLQSLVQQKEKAA